PAVQSLHAHRALRHLDRDGALLYGDCDPVLPVRHARLFFDNSARGPGRCAARRRLGLPHLLADLPAARARADRSAAALPVHVDLERPPLRPRAVDVRRRTADHAQPARLAGRVREQRAAGRACRCADRLAADGGAVPLPRALPAARPRALDGARVTVSAAPTPGAASAARAGRVALPERDIEDGPREELRRGVGGVELAVPGLVVRAGDLPLLRHRNGGLEQAVRVVVEAEPGLGAVRLELPGAEPASVGGHVRQRVLLYVPETCEPRPLVLAVEAGGTRHKLPFELRPQRRWEVYLCHQSHLDIGYTDRQDLVLAHH